MVERVLPTVRYVSVEGPVACGDLTDRERGIPGGRGLIAWLRGCRARGSAASPAGSKKQPDPDRKEAPVDQGAAAHRPGILGAQETGRPRGPAHCVRGSRLPEHLRMLGGPEATFLIGGDRCTRRCDFCQIDTGKPASLDTDEPRRVAGSVASMGLRYATVTGVARDDLPDGAAWLYAETCRQIHFTVTGCGVELLIPDFNAGQEQLALVFAARPEVLAHNLETVPRIFRRIPPGVPLQAIACGAGARPRRGPCHEVEPDPGAGRGTARGSGGHAGPARRRLRAADDHAVPAAVGAPPPGGTVGRSGGIRRVAGGGTRDRVRWGHVRAAGSVFLPRRAAVPGGDSPPPTTPWFRYGGGRSRMSLHIKDYADDRQATVARVISAGARN